MTNGRLVSGFWAHLIPRRKQQLAALLALMVLASFAEVLSLGAVLPFLGVLTQPEAVFSHPSIQPILRWWNITDPKSLLLPITLGFIGASLLAGAMRLTLLYVQTKLSYAIGADFSYQIYRRTLYQSYAVHVSRNSSEVIGGVTTKASMIISYFLTPILTLISSSVTLVAVMTVLLVVNFTVSLVAFLGFGTIYGVVILATRRRLSIYSRKIAVGSNQVVKVLQEGLGGIRDVLLDGAQETYCQQYRLADTPLRHAQASSIIIGGAPRFAVESLGMALIAALAYVLASQSGGITGTISLLGVLAMGAQRLLPALQQGYLSVVQLRSGRHSLQDALSLLNQPIDERVYGTSRSELNFDQAIRLENLEFRYNQGSPLVLRGLNLTIPRGTQVGFVGTTGSGKSTLLDIIMGLLSPTAGALWIDDTVLDATSQRAWQHRIAHVPQFIYLADASVAENIALGIPPAYIDIERVRRAARQAQISSYIESLSDGYDSRVGERGVRLSGGQRQRIGIARALYKRAEVIILDEATSALDSMTERAVMDAVNALGDKLTILIIAHRLTTLQNCDQIVELEKGEIIRVGTYIDIISSRRTADVTVKL